VFLICLTHDIEALDHPFSSPRAILRAVLNSRTRKLALNYIMGNSSARKNPFDTFDTILKLERDYKATSTFFSMPFASARNLHRLRQLRDQAEVGLHGIGESFQSLSVLQHQKGMLEATLGAPVTGARIHRLNLMIPRTFDFEKYAGFGYDSTYFPPRYGQRRTYRPFFAVEGLLEIPLAIMDSDFAEMSTEKAWTRIESILEEHRRNEGVCTILWHPHSFYDEGCAFHTSHYAHLAGFKEIYERILRYGQDNADDMCSCRRIQEEIQHSKLACW